MSVPPPGGHSYYDLVKDRYVDSPTSIEDATEEWTPGEQRAYEKYGLGGGGWPGGWSWYTQQGQQPLPGMWGSQDIQADRSKQSALLDLLQRRATGQDLYSHQQGREAAARMQRQAQSAAATGPYDPAVQRSATAAAARAPQSLAGGIEASALAEQMAYQRAMQAAAAQMQGQEGARWADLANQGLAEQRMRNLYGDLGLKHLGLQRKYQSAYDVWADKKNQENAQRGWDAVKAGAETWGTIVGKSDVNAKTARRPAGPSIEEFLAALSPETYRYKKPGDPGAGPGRHTGVMAQDLERSELGRQLVRDTPKGKVVDYGKAMPALLASLVHLHQRQRMLEQTRGMPGGAPYPGFDEGGAGSVPEVPWAKPEWAEYPAAGPAVDEMGVPLGSRGAYAPPARVEMPPLMVEGRGPTGPGPLVDEQLQPLALPEQRVTLRRPMARR